MSEQTDYTDYAATTGRTHSKQAIYALGLGCFLALAGPLLFGWLSVELTGAFWPPTLGVSAIGIVLVGIAAWDPWEDSDKK